MKFNLLFFVSLALILIIISGCSNEKSKANTVNGVTAQPVQLEENIKDKTQNILDQDIDNESEDFGKQLVEPNKTGNLKIATNKLTDLKNSTQTATAIKESKTLNDFTIRLLEIREFTDDFVQSSKDKFLKIKLELINNGEEEANFSSLRHLSLLANSENQDLAIFTDDKNFEFKLLPKVKMVEEIIFDSILVDNYVLIIKDPQTNEEIEWIFSNRDILVES